MKENKRIKIGLKPLIGILLIVAIVLTASIIYIFRTNGQNTNENTINKEKNTIDEKEIVEVFSNYLRIEHFQNSNIGPMPGLLSELGLCTKEELNNIIQENNMPRPYVELKSNVKYEDFKAEMLKYMTENWFENKFSQYKNLDGYVTFHNCSGSFNLMKVEKCENIVCKNNLYTCTVTLKDLELYEHFLNEKDTTEYLLTKIVTLKKMNENLVVDEVK